MRTHDTLNRIAKLLAIFSAECGLQQKASFTDLNRTAQDVLCGILARIFDLPNLRNLDHSLANHPAIDLGDQEAKVAFQITGDPSGEKIRKTLEKFFAHGLRDRYEVVYICVLGEKQARYSTTLGNVVPADFAFTYKEHVFALNSLLNRIQGCPLAAQLAILEILEREFGEDGLWMKAVSAARITELQAVFVAPIGFEGARTQLSNQGLLIISGPPHVGKSSVGLSLLLDGCPGGRVLELDASTAIKRGRCLKGESILIDDPFGEVTLNDHFAANSFPELVKLGRENRVVLPTREVVLEKARRETKLGERGDVPSFLFELRQEGAYDDAMLKQILAKHIDWRLKSNDTVFGLETADYLRSKSRYIVSELRFPHNLERLVDGIRGPISNRSDLMGAVARSKDIARSAQQWFENLAEPEQLRVVVACILPWLCGELLDQVIERLSIGQVRECDLLQSSGGFLRRDAVLSLAHPSYREGIVESLRNSRHPEAWRVLSAAAQSVPSEFVYLPRLMIAKRLVGGDRWHWGSLRHLPRLELDTYFLQFITAYNRIIGTDFPGLRPLLEPGTDEPARIHYYVGESEQVIWSLFPQGDKQIVTKSYMEVPMTYEWGFTEAEIEIMQEYHGQTVSRHCGLDTSLVPEIEAFEDIWKQVRDSLGSKSGLLLSPTQQHAALFEGLLTTDFPVQEISASNPLSGTMLRLWFEPYLTALTGGQWPESLPFPKKQMRITGGVVNGLDIEWAAAFADRMAQEGKPITGDLLVGGDHDPNRPAYRYPIGMLSDWYSDERLVEAVRAGLVAHYEAVKEALETALPSLCEKVLSRRPFPMLITCLVDRQVDDYMSRPRISYGLSVSDEREPPVQCRIRLASAATPREERMKFDRDCDDLRLNMDHCFYEWGGTDFYSLIRHERWLESVARDIKQLLERFMNEEEYRLFGQG